MKSSRRHELKANELAVQLEKAKQLLSKYGSQIAAVVVLIVVVIGIGLYLRVSGNTTRQYNWQQVGRILANDRSAVGIDLEQLAMQTSDPKLAAIAWKLHGDSLLAQLTITEGIERESLAERIRQAYRQVIEKRDDNTVAAEASIIGLGVLAENLNQWQQAREYYRQLTSDGKFVDTPFGKLAEQRLADLDRLSKPVVFPTGKPILPTTQEAIQSK